MDPRTVSPNDSGPTTAKSNPGPCLPCCTSPSLCVPVTHQHARCAIMHDHLCRSFHPPVHERPANFSRCTHVKHEGPSAHLIAPH
mmetsp:Transcript_4164/g.7337  ORF Transcript_4164/g.7337 Transcript_4164/m.7337 type:complete len:85 (-) Transcript_4164:772-1026(-)